VEAIGNIRTVVSLHQERTFVSKYISSLTKQKLKRFWIRGFTLGFSQSINYYAYAVAFYYGSYLITERMIAYGDLIK